MYLLLVSAHHWRRRTSRLGTYAASRYIATLPWVLVDFCFLQRRSNTLPFLEDGSTEFKRIFFRFPFRFMYRYQTRHCFQSASHNVDLFLNETTSCLPHLYRSTSNDEKTRATPKKLSPFSLSQHIYCLSMELRTARVNSCVVAAPPMSRVLVPSAMTS